MWAKKILIVVLILSSSIVIYAQTREPAVSGMFYPANPGVLKKQVEEFIDKAGVDKDKLPKGQLIGIVSPHAGYPYSGPVSGYAYKILEGLQYDTVIILGPNHRAWGFTDMSVWDKGSFKTPLGNVIIDTELAKLIINENVKKYVFYPDAHKREHSIEVQLPFLQIVLKDFKIVPIVMGDYSKSACEELARAILKNIAGRKVLVIASSDLSHDMPYDKAVGMDRLGLNHTANLSIEELVEAESKGKTQMCGYGPVLTLLFIAKGIGNVNGVLLDYANSGDTTGNKLGRIVGYGAVAFYKEGENMSKNGYSLEEKKELLKLARNTITDYISSGKTGDYAVSSKKFEEARGVFVTLHKHGQLRGCIGYIEPIKPLQQAVIDNAVNSATHDPRFKQVAQDELSSLEIELSVLTPPEEIKAPDEFIVGEHGIIIKKGIHSAVFLPQVAPEQRWTREETLSHLCSKAGLSPDEWKKPGMSFFVFTAEVFSEKEFNM